MGDKIIKDAEIAMVNAATYATGYLEKKHNADVDEIIKSFLQEQGSKIKPKVRLYSVAAINEIMKMKLNRENRGKTDKQLIQSFMKTIPLIINRIDEDSD